MTRKILITGSEPRASVLAGKISQLGIDTVISPLLEIIDLAPNTINVANLQAVIITSQHALNAAKKFKHLPLTVVGKATAQTALAEGFSLLFHAPDIHRLCAQIRQDLAPSNGGLLYLAGKETSTDIKKLLPKLNLTQITVYEALPNPLSPEAINALSKSNIEFVTLLSKRTAEIFRQQIQEHNLTKQLTSCVAICFSEQIAEITQLLPWKHVLVTPQPDEGSLLDMLRIFTKKS